MATARHIVESDRGQLEQQLISFVANKGFPCTGAKTALSMGELQCIEARDLRCPADDLRILEKLKEFVRECDHNPSNYRSLVIMFKGPTDLDEKEFEAALWQRLEALHAIDRQEHEWDPTVSNNPADENFSFSLVGRAFYVVGMHPKSSRRARATPFPALAFNLHAQFEQLRQTGEYGRLQRVVRRRDEIFSGSLNPMLRDFRSGSEARQYSGRQVDESWKCPFSPAVSEPS